MQKFLNLSFFLEKNLTISVFRYFMKIVLETHQNWIHFSDLKDGILGVYLEGRGGVEARGIRSPGIPWIFP